MNENLLGVSAFIYLVAAVFYIVCALRKQGGKLTSLATAAAWTGWILNSAAIVVRYGESIRAGYGYFPLSNLYESMAFFAWALVLMFLVFDVLYGCKKLGAAVTPLAFLAIASVRFNPSFSGAVRPLPPETRSYLLLYHVVTCVAGYAAFAISFVISVAYLLLGRLEASKQRLADGEEKTDRSKKFLEELSYRAVAIGFPFLTVGIVIGAIWAKEAWGRYWGWDSKETWSFITWIIYAAYLHARLTAGWRGGRMAWLSIVGFIAVLLTYWGVTYFLPGRHSVYAS